jgi:hypothetical protein
MSKQPAAVGETSSSGTNDVVPGETPADDEADLGKRASLLGLTGAGGRAEEPVFVDGHGRPFGFATRGDANTGFNGSGPIRHRQETKAASSRPPAAKRSSVKRAASEEEEQLRQQQPAQALPFLHFPQAMSDMRQAASGNEMKRCEHTFTEGPQTIYCIKCATHVVKELPHHLQLDYMPMHQVAGQVPQMFYGCTFAPPRHAETAKQPAAPLPPLTTVSSGFGFGPGLGSGNSLPTPAAAAPNTGGFGFDAAPNGRYNGRPFGYTADHPSFGMGGSFGNWHNFPSN